MSKKSKKEARRAFARRIARMAPPPSKALRLVKPKVEAGPTAQTVANLKPDTLKHLLELGVIDKQLVGAGMDIDRCWGLRVPNDHRSHGAGPGIDPETEEDLLLTWRRWCEVDSLDRPCNELHRRCRVYPGTIVQWLRDFVLWSGNDNSAKPKCSTLVKALKWWQEAKREATSGHRAGRDR